MENALTYNDLSLQGDTHDDVLLIATSLLRVVVKAVITMDRSLSSVVCKVYCYLTFLVSNHALATGWLWFRLPRIQLCKLLLQVDCGFPANWNV